jgi:hypothetical protein
LHDPDPTGHFDANTSEWPARQGAQTRRRDLHVRKQPDGYRVELIERPAQ